MYEYVHLSSDFCDRDRCAFKVLDCEQDVGYIPAVPAGNFFVFLLILMLENDQYPSQWFGLNVSPTVLVEFFHAPQFQNACIAYYSRLTERCTYLLN